jgi:ribosomal protein S18 acetylase RimI-like enzyme
MPHGKIIATETDKQGVVVTVRYAEEIGNTPVVSAFLRNLAGLIDQGYSLPMMAGANRHRAVYIELEGQVIGHIVFDILEPPVKTAWIVLSAVDPDYKRRGLYTILHRHFEEIAVKMGAKKIASFVHVDNTARQKSCEQVGMVPVYYRMEKDL